MAKYVVEGSKECGQAFKEVIDGVEKVDLLGHYLQLKGPNDEVLALFDSYRAKRVVRKEG